MDGKKGNFTNKCIGVKGNEFVKTYLYTISVTYNISHKQITCYENSFYSK